MKRLLAVGTPSCGACRRIAPLASIVLGALMTLLSLTPAHAAPASQYRLAVVELRNEAELRSSEIAYLTDQARTQASKALPGERFLVMTRESIVALLPPGKTLADCAKGQCEVEVGRTIGADYIVTGEVLRFGESLRLNLKVHACQSGAFLGSEGAKGAKVDDLEAGLAEACGKLFALVRTHAGVGGASGAGGETSGSEGSIGGAPPVDLQQQSKLSADGKTVTRGPLMWSRSDNGKDVNIKQAAAYCEACRLGGYTDWRVPTIDELQTLFDPSQSREVRVSPGGDRVAALFTSNRRVFQVHIAEPFLLSSVYAVSSTTDSDLQSQYYDFFDGKRRSRPVNERAGNRVICVRANRTP